MKLPKGLALTLVLLFRIPAIAALNYTITGTRGVVPIPESELQASVSEGPALGSGAAELQPRPRPSKTTNFRLDKRNLYSENWAGIYWASPDPTTTPVAMLGGYWVVPTPTFRAGTKDPSATQTISEWIGVDGIFNENMLYAGVTQTITSDGNTTTSVWWEWYPDARVTWAEWEGEGELFSPGDYVYVTFNLEIGTPGSYLVTFISPSSGTTYGAVASGGPTLDLSTAEWIVSADNGDAFPTFGDVKFFNIWAQVGTYAPTNSVPNLTIGGVGINLESMKDGKIFASTTTVSYWDTSYWFYVDSEDISI
ncbi:concanavalin A-like lectin/glucanase [Thozetella sp. PMI_491]|nr:concanavalin A-like lectin/glucanase [Thozetella sp. PMI_491]